MNKVLTIILSGLIVIALIILLITKFQLDSREVEIEKLNARIGGLEQLTNTICEGSSLSSTAIEKLVNDGYQINRETKGENLIFHLVKESGDDKIDFSISTNSLQIISNIKLNNTIED